MFLTTSVAQWRTLRHRGSSPADLPRVGGAAAREPFLPTEEEISTYSMLIIWVDIR